MWKAWEMQALMEQGRQASTAPTQQEEELGDLLFALVSYARFIAVNPEDALEKANRKFMHRCQYVEQQLAQHGKQVTQLLPQELLSYWEQAKKQATS